ncbi:MAG: VOC family protein [Ilumatobacteraceae bacterium]|nr:VOC family protein [Ilumatobacteraceae bacterium]
MSLSIAATTFDCHDALKVAEFWSAAFDQPIDPEPAPSQFFASIGRSSPDGAGPQMMFINVSESKTVKNRVHLDLQADDRAAEVERLSSLGATVVHDKEEWGVRWTTMADPEGNEFCVATH